MSTQAHVRPTTKRYDGKKVALGLASILVAGVTIAVTAWHLGKDPQGPVLAVVGVDADSAVVLRRGFEERGYIHLVSMTRDGEVRWSEALFGLQDPISLAVSDGLAFVRVTQARGNPVLQAYDIETGRREWEGPDPQEQGDPITPPLPSLHARGVVWEIAGRDPMVVSIVSTAGELVARQELMPPAQRPDAFLIDAGLAITSAEGWVVIDAGGETTPLAEAPSPPDRTPQAGEQCTPSHAGGVTWSCRVGEVFVRD